MQWPVLVSRVSLLSLVEHAGPQIRFLIDEAGIGAPKLPGVIAFMPPLVSLSISAKLRRNLLFLRSLGLSQEKLGPTLTLWPQLLVLSVAKKMKPTIDYMVDVLGVPREKLGSIVAKKPQMLAYSLEKKLRPAVSGTLAPAPIRAC